MKLSTPNNILQAITDVIYTESNPRDSIWELTSDFTRPSDDVATDSLYEIAFDNKLLTASYDMFSSWTGHRFINGHEYHGPIFIVDTTTIYTGYRHCHCHTCQGYCSPAYRQN